MIEAVIFDWAGTTIDYGSFAPVAGFIESFIDFGVLITPDEARKPMGMHKLEHTRAIAAIDRVRNAFIAANGRDITEKDILDIYDLFKRRLFENLADHTDLKPGVIDTINELRKTGIVIGSTTGYTRSMMDVILPAVSKKGYAPDFCVASDEVPAGRPYPFMLWKNMIFLNISDPRHVLKVGDTAVDMEEAANAGVWSAAIINGSSEIGLTQEEELMSDSVVLAMKKKRARQRFYEAGADYIIEDISEIDGVIRDINRKLAIAAKRKLLTPGPLSTRKQVKDAMITDHCTWDNEYMALTRSVLRDINSISADKNYATVLFQGSGTYSVEAMVNCLSWPGEKLLVLQNGEYGRRIGAIAARSSIDHMILPFNETEPLSAEMLDETLASDQKITSVIFVHCETTTGILNPLESLVTVSKKHKRKVYVDAMSSFAAYDINMPALDIDALAASSNKCLEGLPGLSFIVAKIALIEQSKGNSKSLSLDLYEQYSGFYHSNGKFRFTSPTNVLLALRQALDEYSREGGAVLRKERYEENHRLLVEGLSQAGVMPLIEPEYQSCIITAFRLGDLDFVKLYAHLKTNGFIIYPGKLTDMPTFRIGNIGDIYPKDIIKLVRIIVEYVDEIKKRSCY